MQLLRCAIFVHEYVTEIMKQKQRNESETMADDDDDWLEAEIQRELDAIDSAELDLCEKADEDDLFGEDDVTSEVL